MLLYFVSLFTNFLCKDNWNVIFLFPTCLASDTSWPHGVLWNLTNEFSWRTWEMFRHWELQNDMWATWLFLLVLWYYNWSCLIYSYIYLFRMLSTKMQFSVASNQIQQSNLSKVIKTKGRSCAISSTNDQFLFLTASNGKIKIT